MFDAMSVGFAGLSVNMKEATNAFVRAFAIPPALLQKTKNASLRQALTVHSPHGEDETNQQGPEKGYTRIPWHNPAIFPVEGTISFDSCEEEKDRGPEEAQREQGSQG